MDLKKTLISRLRRYLPKGERPPDVTAMRGEVIGAIDLVRDGYLHGWIADRHHRPPSTIDCTIDGDHVASATELYLRKDLKDLGYGDGVLGFRLPIAFERLDGQPHDVRVHAFDGGRSLGELYRRMKLVTSTPVNDNPFLALRRSALPEGWAAVGDADALSVTLQLGNHLPHGLRTFLRLTADIRSDAETGLCQPLPELSQTATVLVVARTLTASLLRIRVGHEGRTRLDEKVPLGTSWSTLRLAFDAVRGHELSLGLEGVGHAVVDVAFVGVFPGADDEAQVPEAPEVAKRPVAREVVDDEYHCPEAIDAPRATSEPRSELAPGWFVDFAPGDEGVLVSIPSWDAAGGADGVAIRHDLVRSFSRLSVRCDRRSLLRRRDLMLSWQVTVSEEPDERPDRFYVQILGREGGKLAKLWQQAVPCPAPGRQRLAVALDRSQMDALRANASAFATFEIALEMRRPYAVVVHGVGVSHGRRVEPAKAQPPSPQAVGGGFESPAVAAQAHRLVMPVITKAAMAHGKSLIDVVVPVHNAAEHVLECLRSLSRANDGSYRVIVLDDASGPRTARLVDRMAVELDIELTRHRENRGYTRTINHGLSLASARHVVFLNSDAVVPRGWHERLLRAFDASDRVAAVGPLSSAASWQSVPYRFAHRGWFVNRVPGGLSVDEFQQWLQSTWSEPSYPEVPILNGFCMAYRREALVSVGGFDEHHFPVGYGEENDVCLRLAAAGHELRVVDDLYVFHAKSRSFGDRRRGLTKAGIAALKEKHPDVDWSAIDHGLRNHPGLAHVRRHICEAFVGEVTE